MDRMLVVVFDTEDKAYAEKPGSCPAGRRRQHRGIRRRGDREECERLNHSEGKQRSMGPRLACRYLIGIPKIGSLGGPVGLAICALLAC